MGYKRDGKDSDMSGLSAERAARNESVFRDANERIEARLDELSLSDGRSPFLCECEDPVCTRPVRLTAAQYEAVRKHSDRFIIASGHAVDDSDVISRHDDFQVIVKRGAEGSIVARLDPRQNGAP
jgi:hypothetical protein